MTTSKYDFLYSSSLTAEPPLYSSLNRLMKTLKLIKEKTTIFYPKSKRKIVLNNKGQVISDNAKDKDSKQKILDQINKHKIPQTILWKNGRKYAIKNTRLCIK